MKRYTYLIAIAAGLTFGLASCKPEIEGELGEVTNKVKGMNGTWELTQFIQQDPNNPVLEERDLSEFYIEEGTTPMRLTLNTSDKSFTVEITKGKNYFGTNGTWALDDNDAPSYVTFYGAEDTLQMDLGRMVLETSDDMNLEYHRVCSDGFKNVIYKFNFKRVN